MKQIINGKRYDTNTAVLLCEEGAGLGRNDFKFWEEELYLKRTGEYFLYGKGGAMSSWATTYSDGTRGYGDGIRPLTESEARQWVERHANDEFESLFGACPE